MESAHWCTLKPYLLVFYFRTVRTFYREILNTTCKLKMYMCIEYLAIVLIKALG